MNNDERKADMESYQSLFIGTGAPERHRRFHIEDNRCELWRSSYEQLKAGVAAKATVGVVGPRGAGKTQAASILLAKNKSDGNSGLYTKSDDIFTKIRCAQSSKSDFTEEQAKHHYRKPYLLVIDAFQVRGETDFENRSLVSIVDKRYDDGKPTVIISNDTQESLLAIVGPDIRDRLLEGGGIITFKSSSFRKLKK